MNISVIFTGGTIGSIKNSDGVISASDNTPPILEEYLLKVAREHTLNFSSPLNMLSETANQKKQNEIIKACRIAEKKSDAVIVTHGTDTLGYTAALLDYALYDIQVPVVLVSSGYVLTDPRANGIRNLKDAISFATNCHTGGVFVMWNGTAHRGTRVLPPEAFTDEVKSLMNTPFGIINNGSFEQIEAGYIRRNDFYPYAFADEERRIVTVTPTPGLNYDAFTTDCDAYLHLSYHSGTTDTENESFRRFCRRMKEADVPVFLHGSYPGAFYETKKLYDELGVIILPVLSASACYEKLLICDFENISLPLSSDIYHI